MSNELRILLLKIRSNKDNDVYIQTSLATVLILTLMLAKTLKINVLDAFISMSINASQFLARFKRYYAIKE